MSTVLMTGFEPFGQRSLNSSWLAVSLLAQTWQGRAELVTRCLPVTFEGCGPVLRRAVRTVHPDVLIGVGEAAGRTHLTPELVGINWDDAAIPDNAGAQPRQEYIEPGGPAARFTGLPIYQAVERMRGAGIPARVSLSAGSYVCNHVMYTIGGLVEASAGRLTGGFCHLPQAPEQVVDPDLPTMSSQLAAQGLGILLETTLESLQV